MSPGPVPVPPATPDWVPLLDAWGDVRIGAPMRGVRSVVYRVDLHGRPAVARRSPRAPESLAWELRLLDHLSRHGLRVPAAIPTADGRPHVDGVMLTPLFAGHPPVSLDDWRLVAEALRRVHDLTRDWPQRPGAVSLTGFTGRSVGVDVWPLPADVRDICRRCWAPLAGQPRYRGRGGAGQG